MYQANRREKGKWRRRLTWLIIILLILLLLCFGFIWIRNKLRPKVTITQARATTTKVTYNSQLTHYDEPDFGIDLPASWHVVPRPPHTYESFTWQSSDVVTDGQIIEVIEDTIPTNFAVNRALVVEGESDHVTIDGGASDNCVTFTRQLAAGREQTGVPAKWHDINFICNQASTQQDVIGTSSADGINTVILHSQGTQKAHKFFFIYTDYATNPDYTVFYDAIQSLHMN